MMFTTESGSVYEVDEDAPRMRRLSGKNKPTAYQGEDNTWRTYVDMTTVKLGESVMVVWEVTEPGMARTTLTTHVTSIEPSKVLN